jgi:lipopolysaccharide transport system ATP-binding protein
LSGIYTPDSGSIEVTGRVAALIELGAGFHPDFSGRENIYIAGVMQGLSKKDIDERFDKLVAFAELSHVIDEPVRTYSSGMFMRLGFSIAVHTNPDILIIDEVLAVGDARFVSKCKDKLSSLKSEGKTLLLVSHDLDAVERWCDEVVWLDKGIVKDRGNPRRVIDNYRHSVQDQENTELLAEETEKLNCVEPEEKDSTLEKRWGSREVELITVDITTKDKVSCRVFETDSSILVQATFSCSQTVDNLVFGIGVNRNDGLTIFGSNTHIEKLNSVVLKNGDQLKLTISCERLGLLEGNYSLDLAVHGEDGYPYDYRQNVLSFSVRSDKPRVGIAMPSLDWDMQIN